MGAWKKVALMAVLFPSQRPLRVMNGAQPASSSVQATWDPCPAPGSLTTRALHPDRRPRPWGRHLKRQEGCLPAFLPACCPPECCAPGFSLLPNRCAAVCGASAGLIAMPHVPVQADWIMDGGSAQRSPVGGGGGRPDGALAAPTPIRSQHLAVLLGSNDGEDSDPEVRCPAQGVSGCA